MPPFGVPTFHTESSFDIHEIKEDILIDRPLESQQLPTKTVRFSSCSSDVYHVRCRADIPPKEIRAVWWSSNDLKQIKQSSHRIVKDVQRFGSSDQCIRGLENLYDSKRKKLCRTANKVVLQIKRTDFGSDTEYYEVLSVEYAKACKTFAKMAHKMGKRDEKVAALDR